MATQGRQGRVGMDRHWLTQRFQSWGDRPALIWRNERWSFTQLCEGCEDWLGELQQHGVKPGDTLAICGDYSPKLCALLLAALLNRNIIIPLTSATASRWDQLLELAQARFAVRFDGDDAWHVTRFDRSVRHPLLREIGVRDAAGLVLFSSGSTGESKASVLDFDSSSPSSRSRAGYRTLIFLLLDHIGGINTLFHVLCHGGTMVTTRPPPRRLCGDRTHRIELLPTTPTFLRMILIADAITSHDLSSLEIVTYGTEPMPASTLAAIREAMPRLRFKQTYGLSELGILPTQSRDSGSIWLKLGNDGFQTRSSTDCSGSSPETAMLGYLNAPSPFDEDGWFNTQDLVEWTAIHVRILGRKSELINVGGEKVHPTEIENVSCSSTTSGT